MKRILELATVLLTAAVFSVGCDRTAEVKQTEKVSGPGGTTTTTVEKKIESSGSNPPANSSGESVPKK